jgi:bacterioferritin-associated ferredoxin
MRVPEEQAEDAPDKRVDRLLGNHTRFICQCFKVTEPALLEIVQRTGCYDYDQLRDAYRVGSRCTSCEVEIRDLLHEAQHARVGDSDAIGIPLGPRVRAQMRRVTTATRFWARRLLRRRRRFGIFAVRGPGYESELVLSNLTFPDDARNANGARVRFDVLLRGGDGRLLGQRRGLSLPADRSRAYKVSEIAAGAPEHFHGTLFVDFRALRETGSLRPYCRFRYQPSASGYQGSCHYHDQFVARPHYQHVVVTHPLHAGETCWIALSNPLGRPYVSNGHLRVGERTLTTRIDIPAWGALWKPVPELFPEASGRQAHESSFFWLDSDAAVMAWFFWHNEQHDLWSAQHK